MYKLEDKNASPVIQHGEAERMVRADIDDRLVSDTITDFEASVVDRQIDDDILELFQQADMYTPGKDYLGKHLSSNIDVNTVRIRNVRYWMYDCLDGTKKPRILLYGTISIPLREILFNHVLLANIVEKEVDGKLIRSLDGFDFIEKAHIPNDDSRIVFEISGYGKVFYENSKHNEDTENDPDIESTVRDKERRKMFDFAHSLKELAMQENIPITILKQRDISKFDIRYVNRNSVQIPLDQLVSYAENRENAVAEISIDSNFDLSKFNERTNNLIQRLHSPAYYRDKLSQLINERIQCEFDTYTGCGHVFYKNDKPVFECRITFDSILSNISKTHALTKLYVNYEEFELIELYLRNTNIKDILDLGIPYVVDVIRLSNEDEGNFHERPLNSQFLAHVPLY